MPISQFRSEQLTDARRSELIITIVLVSTANIEKRFGMFQTF